MIILKYGKALLYGKGLVECDLGVVENRIVSIGQNLDYPDAQVIDCTEKVIVPGLIDVHTHLREPGMEHKETVGTGSLAALRGGFTSIFCMPNTKPAIDSVSSLDELNGIIKRDAVVGVYPIAAITPGLLGERIADIKKLAESGAKAFSDDGMPVDDSAIMRKVLGIAKELNLPVISHTEVKPLAEGGCINEGEVADKLGLKGIPGESEEIMIARDIILNRNIGAKLHIAHVSTKGSVELVRRAKADGIRVTAEVNPMHFALTEQALLSAGADAKVNPPLRTEEDRLALIEGLVDGTIDMIASDHAPHAEDEKALGIEKAPFGISGLETSFALSYSTLVLGGFLSVEELIKKMSYEPARLMNLDDRAQIIPGAIADLVVIDLSKKWKVDRDRFHSKGHNTPIDGKELTGDIHGVILSGHVKLWNGKQVDERGIN